MPAGRQFKNPRALADHFLRLEAECDEKLWVFADAVMHGAEQAIKDVYGDELRLEPLKESTVIEKERLGVDDPYAPLIRWGDLREATYGEMIETRPGNITVAVGNDTPYAKWHEQGTSKMAARPVHWIGANDIRPMLIQFALLFASAIATGDIPLGQLRRLKIRKE